MLYYAMLSAARRQGLSATIVGVQQNKTLLMSGLVGEDSDDSMDSDEDDSDDPASRSQSPARRATTSAGASGGRPTPKRDRPDDMLDTFVQVKRANVPLSSLLAKAEVSAPPSGRASPTSTEGPTSNGATEGVQPLV